MTETPNHGYNVPDEGATDWHEPLNENFEQYDTDIEIRDRAGRRSNYEPLAGTKFLAVDTGVVSVGDGSTWTAAFKQPGYEPSPEAHAGSIVQGSAENGVLSDVRGGTIAGGGLDGEADGSAWSQANRVSGDYGTVSGGRGNSAGATGTVGGGVSNTADGESGAVGGGSHNEVAAKFGTIAGGGPSDTDDPANTGNVVYDEHGTIAGGGNNQVGDDDGDATSATYGAIGGGRANTATYYYSTIAGGWKNTNSGRYAAIGGGNDNEATASGSVVGGGQNNEVHGNFATVGGGARNAAGGSLATVGGGSDNTASGEQSTIPGGEDNEALGENSFAAGTGARARADGTFVWGDSSFQDVVSDQADEFKVQAGGGAVVYSDSGLSAGVNLPPGSGSWSSVSTRTAKTNVSPVDPEAVLDGVEALDVSTWEYDAEDDATHMGPMAEDFHEAFGLGADERNIANVDADGVAMAAIQGLAERVAEKDRRIESLEDAVAKRSARIEGLEAIVDRQQDRIEEQRTAIDDLKARLEALEADPQRTE